MKSIFSLLFLSSSAFAASPAFTGTVVCTGVNPHVNKITFTLTIDDKGAAKSSMTYQNIQEDGEQHAPNSSDFDPRDILEATLGYQRVNFTFGHHNTVVKVSADGDIFGGASEKDDENAPFQGVLFYESGNGNASIDRFQITCRKTK
jgi:hypothetical protein